MRRLFAAPLFVVLFSPWLVALSGVATIAAPCRMHGAMVSAGTHQHKAIDHSTHQHTGNTAHGCNCAGECGRIGVQVIVADLHGTHLSIASSIPASLPERVRVVEVLRRLPPNTGPPAFLRS